VDVDPQKRDDYHGEVEIELELDAPRRTLELHADDLRVSGAHVEIAGRTLRGKITRHPSYETVRVQLPERLPAGRATLTLAFAGKLRKDLRGLYASSAGKRKYAFTQLEATDARRFFPCFDEPTFKARFTMSVTTSQKNTVLANAPIASTKRLPRNRKLVRFRPTPPLSTYLVALAVGELEGSKSVKVGRTPIRVWHVPGKRKLTGFALDCARASLERLEAWFDLPYPYAKLDLVAVPDFEAGAMENAGAVFFRETLLLTDPKTVTVAEKKRVAEVVCHELAHMWYGDLVTMAWWDDLWLNEAFATWMAFAIIDDWKPEWKMWLDFQHYRGAALNLDALDNTHPIYVEVKTPDEATENFDLITYEKGASVVRMVENWLGPAVFRRGVRRYVRTHAEGNTVAADLWNALARAAKQEVEPVVRAWIEQPGFPVLSLRHVRERGRSVLHASQERFVAGRRKGAKDRTRWPIPWVGRVGGARKGKTKLERRLLEGARDAIELGKNAPRFVHGNAEASGFYRTDHDAAMLRDLVAGLGSLSDVERLCLVADQWALARAGRASIESFLDLVAGLGGETEPDVLVSLRGALAFANDQLAAHADLETRNAWRSFLIETFGEHLLELGWRPVRGEDEPTRVRRAVAISLLGHVARWEAVTEVVAEKCAAYLDDRASLEPNLADPVVTLAARQGDARLYARFEQAVQRATTPQGRRRFLFALGDFRDPKLLDRTRRACLDDVPVQDMPFLLVRMLQNPAAREDTWAFLQKRWGRLSKRFPPALVTRVLENLPELQTAKHRREVAAFFRQHPVPTGKRTLQQALERFELNAQFRERAAPGFARWLARRRG
jgi:puromycin-sensitive aminopeptidase